MKVTEVFIDSLDHVRSHYPPSLDCGLKEVSDADLALKLDLDETVLVLDSTRFKVFLYGSVHLGLVLNSVDQIGVKLAVFADFNCVQRHVHFGHHVVKC